eukprot:CAMPEP_0201530400 /NCGR_PEP_ID=MMETSP0161_2-20130828/44552_1 /ASSEMBLY_ACC=CAM_ASM_000251 /TAXON_ID=180227 /ORGANISM="Neoparamoeba aestuarina, Strain SoJaBio B1-5/56/2" /LENGTH=258 /DNA_ID=CAMNT_0047932739 /DNA_START=65 /DNA_END=841 /DNA_ORIENTATION=+
MARTALGIQLQLAFESNRNAKKAVHMQGYLRDQFILFGLQQPERRKIALPILKEHPLTSSKQLKEVIDDLWDLPEREFQYTAMDIWKGNLKYTPSLSFIRGKIISKSWWDTVDFLASHPLGEWVRAHPKAKEQMRKWNEEENMWLRRSSIIHQLRYKHEVDKDLLFELIENQADDHEFFIQKAIGWSLRELSKTDRDSVTSCMDRLGPRLSTLALREGSKYLEEEQRVKVMSHAKRKNSTENKKEEKKEGNKRKKRKE